MNTTVWKATADRALADGAFPCYAAAVGCSDEIFFRAFGGYRAHFPEKLPLTEDTLFDMASLTKLIGTTMAALRLIDRGVLRLTDTLGSVFEHCYGKESITIRQLMTHSAGFAAHMPLWSMGITPADAVDAILSRGLKYPTDSRVEYSCMGYIVLGKLLERISGKQLDTLVREEVFVPLGMKDSCYCPSSERICAATEKKSDSEHHICGHVHDENAHFLDGVAGNAGIFCTLDDTVRFATMLSRHGDGYLSQELFETAITDLTRFDPDNARGLGFHLYRGMTYPGGDRMSLGSFGHTGFTGTTLYVDRERGIYCIMLSNRVHFGRENERFFAYRRAFYDAVFSDPAL